MPSSARRSGPVRGVRAAVATLPTRAPIENALNSAPEAAAVFCDLVGAEVAQLGEDDRERTDPAEVQRGRDRHGTEPRGRCQVPQAGDDIAQQPVRGGGGGWRHGHAEHRQQRDAGQRDAHDDRGLRGNPARERAGERWPDDTRDVVRGRLRAVCPAQQCGRHQRPDQPGETAGEHRRGHARERAECQNDGRRRVPGRGEQPHEHQWQEHLVRDERGAPVMRTVQPCAEERSAHQLGQRQRSDEGAGQGGGVGAVQDQQHHRHAGGLVGEPRRGAGGEEHGEPGRAPERYPEVLGVLLGHQRRHRVILAVGPNPLSGTAPLVPDPTKGPSGTLDGEPPPSTALYPSSA